MKKYFKRITSLSLVLAMTLALSGCSGNYKEQTVYALDTVITFKTDCELPDGTEEFIKNYEKMLSYTYEESEIYKLNGAEFLTCSEETAKIIKKASEISEATNGAFDITCGGLKELWGINTSSARIPEQAELDLALNSVGREKISVSENTVRKSDKNTKIDLGGIAKGYIAEKTVEFLKANGVVSGIASFGGNIAVIGRKNNGENWKIGIKNPENTALTVGTVELSDGFVSVSGGYERYSEIDGKLYHHIFDTATGYPSDSDLLSSAVVCSDGMLADALSTAIFVMGTEKAIELYNTKKYDFEAVLVTKNKKIYVSNGIKDKYTNENGEYAVEYFGD